MSEFLINEPSQNNDDNNKNQSFRIPLSKLSQVDIIKIFDLINEEERQIVIPVGFPSAGKSLFLSSLMYYSAKYTGKKWTPEYLMEYPFDKGNLSRNQMVEDFEQKKAYPVTITGSIDLMGMNIEPNNGNL